MRHWHEQRFNAIGVSDVVEVEYIDGFLVDADDYRKTALDVLVRGLDQDVVVHWHR